MYRPAPEIKPPRHTFGLAKRREIEIGKPQYVVQVGELFIVDERMPMIGVRWWDADGIRHG